MMKREWFSIGIHLGYVYEGSPIVVPDGTPRPETRCRPTRRRRGPARARRTPGWSEDRSTLDLFGKELRAAALRRPARPMRAGSSRRRQERGVPFEVVDIDHAEAAQLYERKLVLVRPDGQVAWRDDRMPADALKVIDTVRGSA